MNWRFDQPGLPGSIFLTGATGVIGGRILLELLRGTPAICRCLVRAKDGLQAHERLARILKVYGMPEEEYQTHRRRILPVLGDITLPHFGLGDEERDTLAHSVNLVIHMAADVNVMAPYTKLYDANVGGTNRVIEFCLHGNFPLVHGSTYSVIGDKIYAPGCVFREDELEIGQRFTDSNYARTKFETEREIRKADAQGLRRMILRFGDVMGDSRSGAYPLEKAGAAGLYYDIMKTVIETGIAPFAEDRFYITPVDYAARATLYLAMNRDAYGSTFHIVNAEQNCFYHIINLLVECGYAVRVFPLAEYTRLFKEKRVWRQGKIYHSIFSRIVPFLSEQPESARMSVSEARRLLAPAGIGCPSPDYNLIATYLNFCIRNGYLPSPQAQNPLAEIR